MSHYSLYQKFIQNEWNVYNRPNSLILSATGRISLGGISGNLIFSTSVVFSGTLELWSTGYCKNFAHFVWIFDTDYRLDQIVVLKCGN